MSAGQVACDEKSNEITAIPELLYQLELKGVVVSIDAPGYQTAIATQIDAAKGDYVLALKGNQGTAHEAVRAHFEQESFEASDYKRMRAVLDPDYRLSILISAHA